MKCQISEEKKNISKKQCDVYYHSGLKLDGAHGASTLGFPMKWILLARD